MSSPGAFLTSLQRQRGRERKGVERGMEGVDGGEEEGEEMEGSKDGRGEEGEGMERSGEGRGEEER